MRDNPALDGVRAIAVAAVVAFHCDRNLFPGGFIGVDIFFVLSGYLITTLLWQERRRTGTIAIGRFYLRRALRLWPPLLLMLLAFVLAAPVFFPQIDATSEASLAALYLSDYAAAFWRTPVLLSHTWSLSVEEHFYLVWPAAVLLLARLTGRNAIVLLVLAFIVATAWRFIDLAIGLDYWRTYYRFDTRMSGLILGGAVALMVWRPDRAVAEAIGLAGLAGLAAMLWTLHWNTPEPLLWRGVVVDLSAAALIVSLTSPAMTALGRALSARPVVYVGLISYSIYLWHYPIVWAARRGMLVPLTLGQSLFVALTSVAIAALSYELLERPLKAYRRSLKPGPPSA